MPAARFRVNTELTAAKAFEDEVVIINTATGRYYDLVGSGSLVWALLERGASVDEIVGSLISAYGVSDDVARQDVGQLLDQLLEEDLVVVANGAGPGGDQQGMPPVGSTDYAPPTLTRYTDMEDLLAADPPLPSRASPGTLAGPATEPSASE